MRLRAVALLVTIVPAIAAASSSAATLPGCGSRNADGDVAQATLTLNKESTTTVAFKRSTGEHDMLLIFDVTGCRLPDARPEDKPVPSIDVLPKSGEGELPSNAIELIRSRVSDQQLSVRLRTATKTFDPGTYGALVEIDTPKLTVSRTPVAVSRSESSGKKPIGYGAVAGLIGILFFLILKAITRAKLTVSWWWLLLVIPLGAVVGGYAGYVLWQDQDVWTSDANRSATLKAGFAAGTTGVMAGILAALVPATPKER
jgi:hypothetical protein